jgi:hypothetical protein
MFERKMPAMDFSYTSYEKLISLLKQHNYAITNYIDYHKYKKAAILRHDIDFSINDSYNFSLFEESLDIKSAYFVLLSTGFYNPMEKSARKMLQDMHNRGFTIGLHFDTTVYNTSDLNKPIQSEKNILEEIIDAPVNLLSFHRPAPKVLENDLKFPGLINVYSKEFFHDFKYCSDSRFFWRDKPYDLITSEKYDRLHILTHAFCWSESDRNPDYVYKSFISQASQERYKYLTENIRNPEEFISEEEAKKLWFNR